jgi:hypothetical protein
MLETQKMEKYMILDPDENCDQFLACFDYNSD